MSKISIFSKVITSASTLSRQLLQGIVEQINKKFFSGNLSSIESRIKAIIENSIKQQPEYASLKSGRLRNEFGIANTGSIDQIIEHLNNIDITIQKASVNANEINAKIVIGLVKDNLDGALGLASASVETEKGSSLNWLRWLLLEGNKTVVAGYKYIPKVSPKSRTGKGIMVKGDSNMYRVPPQYAGTANNNWITRALDQALPDVQSEIDRYIQRLL